MKPRSQFSRSSRTATSRHNTPSRPRPSSKANDEDTLVQKLQDNASDPELNLSDEITLRELDNFASIILNQVTLGETITRETVQRALANSLESYILLKQEYKNTVDIQAEHSPIAKALVKTTQAIIDTSNIDESQKQELLDTAISAIEKNFQLKHRIKNLRRRLEFLDAAIPEYLVTYGVTRGTLSQPLHDLAKQTRLILEQY